MVTELGDVDGIPGDFANDTMLVIDAAGPISGKGVFQRLGFADAFKKIALDLFDERIDAPEDFTVGLLPIKVVLPSVIGKDQLHSISSLSIPDSASSCLMDSNNRRLFLGERSR